MMASFAFQGIEKSICRTSCRLIPENQNWCNMVIHHYRQQLAIAALHSVSRGGRLYNSQKMLTTLWRMLHADCDMTSAMFQSWPPLQELGEMGDMAENATCQGVLNASH